MHKTRWRPPHLFDSHEERRVSWLELFYDLIYVVIIAELGNLLSHDVSWVGVLEFVLLFIPVWWSWTGITFYVNRIVVDDIWHRLLIFTQMTFVAVMAISVEHAFGETFIQFTLVYVSIQSILIVMYLRAGWHIERSRPLMYRYAKGNGIAIAIWLVSAFTPPPYRYLLAGVGMAVHFAVAWSPGTRKLTGQLPPNIPHMSERYGLLTIIVLGETFVKVVDTNAGELLTITMALYGSVALILGYSLWWLYFDHVAGAEVKRSGNAPYVWVYSHLPLTISLVAFGVSMKKLVQLEAGEALEEKYLWLIGGSLIIYLLASAAITESVRVKAETLDQAQADYRYQVGAAVVVLGLTVIGGWLPPLVYVALVALTCVIPIVVYVRRVKQEPAH
jgi:low temperature requirement protein LtrA